MADDKKDIGEPDHSFVASGQDYEVQHFAQKFGLSQE